MTFTLTKPLSPEQLERLTTQLTAISESFNAFATAFDNLTQTLKEVSATMQKVGTPEKSMSDETDTTEEEFDEMWQQGKLTKDKYDLLNAPKIMLQEEHAAFVRLIDSRFEERAGQHDYDFLD